MSASAGALLEHLSLAQASRPFPDWEWLGRNGDRIVEQTIQHVQLTAAAVAIGLAIAFPLALVAIRWRWLYQPLLQVTGILFTVPSLALFVLLVAFAGTGLSTTTSLIGLVTYTLLILLRNIVVALDGVPPDVRESAIAMGYRRARLLWAVQLPLATPVIMAGVRIATVTTVGLVTVTYFVGQGGLAQILFEGFNRDNLTATLVGFVLSVVLALVADLVLMALQRRLTPWARRSTA